jgi:hypothetical protein
VDAVSASVTADPESAPAAAQAAKGRLAQLTTREIAAMVDVLLSVREKLPDPAREELTGILHGECRQELIRRMSAGESPLDTILALTQLKNPGLGWRELGRPPSAERIWRFTSFEPQAQDFLHPREGKRFRDVAVPAGMENWNLPEFDAGKWTAGNAPIGKGVFAPKRGKTPGIENRSVWPDGEFLLARTTFELDALDCDFYRLSVLAKQGYHIYLNGRRVSTYIWWTDAPTYRKVGLGADAVKSLQPGANVLAVYANAAYVDGAQVGQLDVRLEGLKQADLLGATPRAGDSP